jgi:NADP-dependent 3-hydroxy acid dehydrogenase YdfG
MSQELVVISGASSGIGRGIARAFAAEGNPLLLISRHIEPLPELQGAQVRYAQADVANYEQVEAAIRAAERDFGETGCLVNGAGFADARNFLEVAPADLAREIDVNLIGLMNCTKVVIGNMSRRRSGTIINISSVSDRKTAPVAVGYALCRSRCARPKARTACGSSMSRLATSRPTFTRPWASPSRTTARRWAIPTS